MSLAKKTHPQSELRPPVGDFMRLPQATSDRPLPMVELLHTLPDGTVHVDWMIAQDPETSHSLITFRLPRPLTELKPGEELIARRIADHRPSYLTYEGPISGGRGTVRCLARGRVSQWIETARGWEMEILHDSETGPVPPFRLRLVPRPDQQWVIVIMTPDSSSFDAET